MRWPAARAVPDSPSPISHWWWTGTLRLYQSTGGAISVRRAGPADAGYDARLFAAVNRRHRAVPHLVRCHRESHDGELVTRLAAIIDVGAAGRVSRSTASRRSSRKVNRNVHRRRERRHAGHLDRRHAGAGRSWNAADPYQAIGVAEMSSGAICASASNRRSWADGIRESAGTWHHIIDPKTGHPPGDVVATWVIAPSAMIADGLATALFFTPAEDLYARSGAWILITC